VAHNFLSALVGSFATPAAENPTVAMIEAAFQHHGMDARYINCEVEPAALGDAARGARAMGWRGFNCSIPHKVAIIEHLDGLGQSAATIGAVNCAVRRGDKLIGENTDGVGFMESLRTAVDPASMSLVVFGAGGAARAIAVEAALAGAATITIVNRGEARGRELTRLINEKTKAKASFVLWDQTYAIDPAADILVNATSIGLFPDVEGRLDIDMSTVRPWRDRRRRHPQSAAHGSHPRGRSARRPHARRARHARQPGRRFDPALVRRRRRSGGDAAQGRGSLWGLIAGQTGLVVKRA
jgi:shikimate dehydrogenase